MDVPKGDSPDIAELRSKGAIIYAVATCDWGVAYEMGKLTAKDFEGTTHIYAHEPNASYTFGGNPFSDRDGKVFRFRRPMDAGLMYPRGDEAWRRRLLDAIKSIIVDAPGLLPRQTPSGAFLKRWNGVEKELRKYGVEPISFELARLGQTK